MKQNNITYIRKPGPPESMEGRLLKEIRVHQLLSELGIPYEYIDHEPIMTMEGCKEADEALEATICKNLFLCNRKKTEFYLLMMPGDKTYKATELSKELGRPRLSFAREEYMEEFLDITPGSVSVMGLMNDKENRVQLLVDEEILNGEYVGCHPCINTASLRIPAKEVFETFLQAIHHDMIVVHLSRD